MGNVDWFGKVSSGSGVAVENIRGEVAIVTMQDD
jgi:hypothetical protein